MHVYVYVLVCVCVRVRVRADVPCTGVRLWSFEIISVVKLRFSSTYIHVHTRVYRVFARELGHASVLDRHFCIHELIDTFAFTSGTLFWKS
jgi:hypothetical protein